MMRPRPARRSAAITVASAVVAAGLVALTAPAAVADVVSPDASATGELLVSRTDAGTSSETFLTSDGQHVVFTSTERLSPADTNSHADVYLSTAIPGSSDPFSGPPQLVSVTPAHGASNAASSAPVASADGRWVAFTSEATNLVAGGGTAGRSHVYVRDMRAGTTLRLQAPGVEPDAGSYDADITDDGRKVVFTSLAENLGVLAGEPGFAHVYLAEIGPGAAGEPSLSIADAAPGHPNGSDQAAIAGNGAALVFRQRPLPATNPYGLITWQILLPTGGPGAMTLGMVEGADPVIDGTGNVIAFTTDHCDGDPHLAAMTFLGADTDEWVGTALGVTDVDNTTGYVSDPSISSNGNVIAWETTQRAADDPSGPGPLPNPVIRVESPSWGDAWFKPAGHSIACDEQFGSDAMDIGEGHAPTLSAAGRTVGFSGARALAPGADESALVFVTDDDGPAAVVTSVQGYVTPPRMIKQVEVGAIPSSAAAGVQSAIAGAPIHQVPIHQVPIHQVPIHQVPIHQVPIHQVPIHQVPIHQVPIHQVPIHQVPIHQVPIHQVPIHQVPIHQVPIYLDDKVQEWAAILVGTPFHGVPADDVTPGDVLDWADAALAAGSGATDAERAAATKIQQLTIAQRDGARTWAEILSGTPFAGLSELTVTIGDVLQWAADTSDDPDATEAEIAAAARIRSLTLGDLGLDGSGLDALSIASTVLGNAPVAKLEIPGQGTARERWQALAVTQGIDVDVEDETTLAALDWAGLDVTHSGIDRVTLGALRADPAVVAESPLASISASSLHYWRTTLGELSVAELSDPGRLFDDPGDGTALSGTLYSPSWAFRDDATAADIVAVAPADLAFGTIFELLLDRSDYPWEQLDIAEVNPAWASADLGNPCQATNPAVSCASTVRFRYAFDSAPGQTIDYLSASLDVVLPTGTWAPSSLTTRSTSGAIVSERHVAVSDSGRIADGNRVRVPSGDLRSGTVTQLDVTYGATTSPADSTIVGRATYTLPGEDEPATTENTLYNWRTLDLWDDPERTLDPSNPLSLWYPMFTDTIYFGWISPSSDQFDGIANAEGRGPDEDFYLVPAPGEGSRVLVSTNAMDGQLSISLYTTANTGAPLGTESAGPAPGSEVAEQPVGTEGDATRAGTDGGTPLLMAPANSSPGGDIGPATLIDESVVAGDGTSQVTAAGSQAADAEYLVLRVASGDGRPSESAYTLRVTYEEEPDEVACAPAELAHPDADDAHEGGDALVAGASGTNTLYLFDQARFDETWGAGSAAAVRQGLDALDGVGGVNGAVVALDSSTPVASARAALDRNPCSTTRRADLTKAVNTYVDGLLDAAGVPRSQITSIVIVGGDDILPFAPVAENVPRFSEAGHAGELRLTTLPDGSPCPSTSVELEVDLCATPLSAAAAAGYVLSDDPYGLPAAYDTSGGVLYVPTAGLGRLVESPEQISATLSRFVAAGGEIAADSLATAGYGAWSELPDLVSDNLAWRSPDLIAVDADGDGLWNRGDVARVLGTTEGSSARVVALNAHFDERRLLPGVPDAPAGRFRSSDLFSAANAFADDATGANPLAGALVFTIGCHAGNNLPGAYYPDATDWVDVFSNAAGFVGNTGYGYANNIVTALSERLLATYSSWLGVAVDGEAVTTGSALMHAKQAYLGGLGLYTGYDEKVLMQTVYYGLPMYTLQGSTAAAPSYKPAPPLVPSTSAGLVSASLSFSDLAFDEESTPDGKDYLVIDDEEQLVVTGEPVLPRLVRELPAAPAGTKARGALISGLTSRLGDTVEPLIAETTAGVDEVDAASRTGMAFPSTFARISRQPAPGGDVDLLVVTPARAQLGANGSGVLETFTDLDLEIVYGDSGSDDDLEPHIESTRSEPIAGGARIVVAADGTGSEVAGGLVLAQPQGAASGEWLPFALTGGPGNWTADVTIDGPFRWFVQVIDAAGNVAIDTGRGHLDVARAAPPELAAVSDVTLAPGSALVQSVEVTDAEPTERLTGTYRWVGAGGSVAQSGIAAVTPNVDGDVHALIDSVPPSGGVFTVELEVCRGDACSTRRFAVTVLAADPPTATVTLTSSDDPVEPTSVLTAAAEGFDPNDDPVTLSYRWLRNGSVLEGFDEAVLDLAAVDAEHGDTFTVEVVPSDGTLVGGAARADLSVGYPPPSPPNPDPPTITATATNADGEYAAGAWSRTPVTVTFACEGHLLASCSEPVTVWTDTGEAGTTVTGEVVDGLDRSATIQYVVKVDGTPPTLAPVVTPNPVTRGAPATGAPNATDAGSGIADGAASCPVPDTSSVGQKSVTCTARDRAGNTATAIAPFVVTPSEPTGPVIRATAKAGSAEYREGTWSRLPVKVSFVCTSGVKVTSCPSPKTVSADTGRGGKVVVGTMKDKLGRTADVRFTVKVDRTAPKLAPSATPSTVAVGGTVVLAAKATDAGSGVVSQSCDAPDTTSKGRKTATCRATDAAGNTAKATVTYTVQAPPKPPKPQPPKCRGLLDRTPLGVVDADGSSVFVKTSGVPILFRACDAKGTPIGTKGFVRSVTQTAVAALPKNARITELWYPPISTFTYVRPADVWVGAIPTAKLSSGKKYTYRVLLADGTSFTVTFGVR